VAGVRIAGSSVSVSGSSSAAAGSLRIRILRRPRLASETEELATDTPVTPAVMEESEA